MGELMDKTKGKAKEVAGVAAGDRDLEAEGKKDRAMGHLKGAFERMKESVKRKVGGDRNRNV